MCTLLTSVKLTDSPLLVWGFFEHFFFTFKIVFMTKESCLGHNSSTINLKLYQKLNSEHFLFFFLTTKIEINLCVVMKTQVVLCVITLVNFILNHIFLSQKLFKTFMLHIERKQYEWGSWRRSYMWLANSPQRDYSGLNTSRVRLFAKLTNVIAQVFSFLSWHLKHWLLYVHILVPQLCWLWIFGWE